MESHNSSSGNPDGQSVDNGSFLRDMFLETASYYKNFKSDVLESVRTGARRSASKVLNIVKRHQKTAGWAILGGFTVAGICNLLPLAALGVPVAVIKAALTEGITNAGFDAIANTVFEWGKDATGRWKNPSEISEKTLEGFVRTIEEKINKHDIEIVSSILELERQIQFVGTTLDSLSNHEDHKFLVHELRRFQQQSEVPEESGLSWLSPQHLCYLRETLDITLDRKWRADAYAISPPNKPTAVLDLSGVTKVLECLENQHHKQTDLLSQILKAIQAIPPCKYVGGGGSSFVIPHKTGSPPPQGEPDKKISGGIPGVDPFRKPFKKVVEAAVGRQETQKKSVLEPFVTRLTNQALQNPIQPSTGAEAPVEQAKIVFHKEQIPENLAVRDIARLLANSYTTAYEVISPNTQEIAGEQVERISAPDRYSMSRAPQITPLNLGKQNLGHRATNNLRQSRNPSVIDIEDADRSEVMSRREQQAVAVPTPKDKVVRSFKRSDSTVTSQPIVTNEEKQYRVSGEQTYIGETYNPTTDVYTSTQKDGNTIAYLGNEISKKGVNIEPYQVEFQYPEKVNNVVSGCQLLTSGQSPEFNLPINNSNDKRDLVSLVDTQILKQTERDMKGFINTEEAVRLPRQVNYHLTKSNDSSGFNEDYARGLKVNPFQPKYDSIGEASSLEYVNDERQAAFPKGDLASTLSISLVGQKEQHTITDEHSAHSKSPEEKFDPAINWENIALSHEGLKLEAKRLTAEMKPMPGRMLLPPAP